MMQRDSNSSMQGDSTNNYVQCLAANVTALLKASVVILDAVFCHACLRSKWRALPNALMFSVTNWLASVAANVTTFLTPSAWPGTC